jgi:hypothetical protein
MPPVTKTAPARSPPGVILSEAKEAKPEVSPVVRDDGEIVFPRDVAM